MRIQMHLRVEVGPPILMLPIRIPLDLQELSHLAEEGLIQPAMRVLMDGRPGRQLTPGMRGDQGINSGIIITTITVARST